MGLLGYAALSLGVPLDLAGVLDMNEGARDCTACSRRIVRVRIPVNLVDREGIYATVVQKQEHVTRIGDGDLTLKGRATGGCGPQRVALPVGMVDDHVRRPCSVQLSRSLVVIRRAQP